MQWFDWFNRIVAYMCSSRQHEAPIVGHVPLSRQKIEEQAEAPAATACDWNMYGAARF